MILLFTYLSCGAVFAQDAGPEIDPFAGINEETDWNVFDQECGFITSLSIDNPSVTVIEI